MDFEYAPNFDVDQYPEDMFDAYEQEPIPQPAEPNVTSEVQYAPNFDVDQYPDFFALPEEEGEPIPEIFELKSTNSTSRVEYAPNFDVDQYPVEVLNPRAEDEPQLSDFNSANMTSRVEYTPNFDIEQYPEHMFDPRAEEDEPQPSTSAPGHSTRISEIEYAPNFDVDQYPESIFALQEESSAPKSETQKPETQKPETQKPETQKTKRKIRDPPDVNKTPVNTVPPPHLDVHAQFSMKVLKTQAVTPMPNYTSMLDEELNDHLDKYGIRPMGRKRAIEELNRIYEATHPVIDDASTPTRERVWSTISEYNSRPKKKPVVSRKRPAPPEFNEKTPEAQRPQTLESLTGDVLRWLRMPQNSEIYKECMALRTIMLDRLIEVFNPVMREKAISKDLFTRILDHLHITYSDKRDGNNHYYY